MTPHTVLVLAYYFPPMGLSGVQRIAKFVKYLPDFGWQTHVLTTGPTAYYAHDPSLLEEFHGRDIVVTRTTGSDPNSTLAAKGTMKMPRESVRKALSAISNTLIIPDNKRGWARRAYTVAKELMQTADFDMIFVSGPPFSAMMAGAQLSSETGIPLVVDYRDLWYGNQFHTYPTVWHRQQHQKMEHHVLARASKITCTNRRIKEKLLNTYRHLEFNDVVILPHGYDLDDLRSTQPRPAGDPSTGTAFRLTYTGIFYDVVTPIPMFKAVRKLQQTRPEMRLELHFAGILRDEYKRSAKRMGLDGIVVDHGYLPHRESVQLCQESDALWMMVGHTRNADTISSGKLYEYFGTRKPLLVSVPEGALRKDAERYGAAWLTEPDDVEAIATAISEMYDQWKNRRVVQPDADVVASFDRRTITGDLARVLAGCLRVT
ncbi:MAG: glycosyltransferase [Candidatus Kapaibacteriota bacterium]